MVDILHKVGIRSSSVDAVFRALTTTERLAGWWTKDTRGDGSAGGTLDFHFGPGTISMKVLETQPGRRVLWQVVAGPDEWSGTTVDWNIAAEGEWTIVRFKHAGWKEPVDFMHHCSTKWGVFLLSLKSLLETGEGGPAPDEVKIDSWE